MLTEEHRKKIKYLSQIKYLDKDINRLVEEADYWRTKAEKVTSSLSNMPRGNGISNKEDIIIKVIDTEDEINRKIDEMIELKSKTEKKIETVSDYRLRAVLRDRYILCKTWEEIAYKNNYSWKYIFALHEKALDKIII